MNRKKRPAAWLPLLSIALLSLLISACSSTGLGLSASGASSYGAVTAASIPNPNADVDFSKSDLKKVYLAGGCFWGVEAYMARIYGVQDAVSGYANGTGENPSYEDVIKGDRGFAETVEVTYDPALVPLDKVLKEFFKVVDPTSVNQQGNDRGIQYRSGVYYTADSEKAVVEAVIAKEQEKYNKKIVTEVLPLQNFYMAEEYHQDYLEKNPEGYCHIDMGILNEQEIPGQAGAEAGVTSESLKSAAASKAAGQIVIDPADYPKRTPEQLKSLLTDIQYQVAVEQDTEHPYSNEYWDTYDPGIYVDVSTGEPLFASEDKYDSQCGWPSFVKPILPEVVTYDEDNAYNMVRTEVRSRSGDIHLGHVFDDGPEDRGGKRYCINSASIKFVPLADMEAQGYGYLTGVAK
ncbi:MULTISPECIES: peptide-methionine (R)-S-oxide reductase MsrB [Saccharibacillus]|uniref:Peptide methionine sulfoxide reductase MsrA n=1 Tax=Saccharibacillus brassicae TaxID=2583377 RepID=A0A4Y6V0N9_SACBS|nr:MULTISPECIES: peptide-methionine (R)-S-oxide reductase MsrB [Saccharibacillus]MWJ30226.1 peptide-methionine (R)-S-oxide reductase MsrB [Saccharibacillus sp. WB 17]QDH23563.1 peptide-methionine (R)-S-oxide reductase MsrB [Saccharibacillus brassicae]